MDVNGRTQNSKMDLTFNNDSFEINNEDQTFNFTPVETPKTENSSSNKTESNSSGSSQSNSMSGIWYSEENGL